jgi:hypothetical protein
MHSHIPTTLEEARDRIEALESYIHKLELKIQEQSGRISDQGWALQYAREDAEQARHSNPNYGWR